MRAYGDSRSPYPSQGGPQRGGEGFSLYERGRARPKVSVQSMSFWKPANSGDTAGTAGGGGTRKLLDASLAKNQTFRNHQLQQVLRFLAYSSFPHKVEPKSFANPSRTLLVEVWNHLFKMYFDDNIEITMTNANEEVPKLFRDIGCPMQLSKSSMPAPGAGHQWAHHLYALSWLCELLIFETEAFPDLSLDAEIVSQSRWKAGLGQHSFSDAELNRGGAIRRPPTSGPDRGLASIIANAFTQLQEGKDAQATRGNILKQIETDIDRSRQTLEKQRRAFREATDALETANSECQANAKLAPDLAAMEADRQKFLELQHHHEHKIASLTDDIQEIEANKKELEEQLRTVTAECDQLQHVIQNQGICKDEMQKITHDLNIANRQLQTITAELEKQNNDNALAHDKINNLDNQIITTSRAVNCLISGCRTAATRLPTSKVWAELKTFSIRSDAADLNEMAGLDWKTWKTAVKKNVQDDAAELNKAEVRLAQENKAHVDNVKDIQKLKRNKSLEQTKLDTLQMDVDAENTQHEDRNNNLSQRIQEIRTNIAGLQDDLEWQLGKEKSALQECSARQRDNVPKYQEQVNVFLAAIESTRRTLLAHKASTCGYLEHLVTAKGKSMQEYNEKIRVLRVQLQGS
eukprot:GHVT01067750.1.p1 GENE.GHVT01067750.1~~GHVT01067750.1.p1  ORF type:complete len:634 (+),score=61.84 GHVT01067750.1:2089-3990(+)